MTDTPTTPLAAGGAVNLRRGAATFGGAVGGAAAGFVLSVLVGRGLGTSGAGVFFSIVAFTTITTTVLKLGTDTAQLWQLPRLVAEGRTRELWPAVREALGPVVIASLLVAVAVVLAAEPIAARLTSVADPGIRWQVTWAAFAVGASAPMFLLIAATRGLGLVRPFVLVQNLGLPTVRLVAVGVVLTFGAGASAVVAAWALPVVVALVLAAAALNRELRRQRTTSSPAPRPRAVRSRAFWTFAAPRGVTATIEAVLTSINVLVVGALLGPAAAGIFGALSRFVTTGTLAEQAVRVLVAPRFSALLAAEDHSGARSLHATTTPWIVLVSAPLFTTIALAAPTLLSLFGDGFARGGAALAVLAIAMGASTCVGNVQTMLLMSGRSDLQLRNRVVAVVVLLGLDAVLIPRYGLVGAGLAWAASIVVDTVLATVQVRRAVGLQVLGPMVRRLLVATAATIAAPVVVLTRVVDLGTVGLALGLVSGGGAYAALVWRWRRTLRLDDLAGT